MNDFLDSVHRRNVFARTLEDPVGEGEVAQQDLGGLLTANRVRLELEVLAEFCSLKFNNVNHFNTHLMLYNE